MVEAHRAHDLLRFRSTCDFQQQRPYWCHLSMGTSATALCWRFVGQNHIPLGVNNSLGSCTCVHGPTTSSSVAERRLGSRVLYLHLACLVSRLTTTNLRGNSIRAGRIQYTAVRGALRTSVYKEVSRQQRVSHLPRRCSRWSAVVRSMTASDGADTGSPTAKVTGAPSVVGQQQAAMGKGGDSPSVKSTKNVVSTGWGVMVPEGFSAMGVALLVVLGALTSSLAMWVMQPLVTARDYRVHESSSEDFFWHVGPEGQRVRREAFPSPSDAPNKLLSVIVPAHNEEDRLPGMLKTTLAYLDEAQSRDSSFTFEVIVVSDGSTDDTSAEVERWCRDLGSDVVRLLELSENQGKGAAVREGMLRMRGEYGLMVDADAATEISDLARLMDRMRDVEAVVECPRGSAKHGMVVGSRAHMEGETIAKRAWHRTLLMFAFHWCVSALCTRQIKDTQCGFKLFTRDTALAVFGSLHLHRWAFDTELVYICQLLGIPMAEVPVNWREVSGSKLIQSKLDVITTSASMLRDMFCVRVCYLLGFWKVAPEANQLVPGGSKATPDRIR